MRTTKHGANMGVLILMSLALVIAANYLGYRFNKSIDVTEEKLNSLSDQTVRQLKALKSDLVFTVFYAGAAEKDQRQQIRDDLSLYTEESPKVKVRFINLYENPGLAADYLKDKRVPFALYVDYSGRRILIDGPYSESSVTSGIIKATRESQKTIYFTTGHGEPNIDGEGGLTLLRKGLEDMSFKVANLNLAMGENMPKGDSFVAIIGPKTAFLDVELERLRDFVKQGGHLLLAIDPGQKHNLANLTKSFGVEFKNNYILTEQLQRYGIMTMGNSYDPNSEITRNFSSDPTFVTAFEQASEIARASDAPASYTFHELVKTEERSVAFNDVHQKVVESDAKRRLLGVQVDVPVENIAATTTDKDGKVHDTPSTKPPSKAEVAIFGDSDFFGDKMIGQLRNRDLAYNIFAGLANEAELTGIRQKMPKGSTLILTQNYLYGVVAAGVSVPVLLLVLAGFFWYRRKNL
jgi:ABC-type uncharacterized transport system involved in gliding motility auxiliary subunit